MTIYQKELLRKLPSLECSGQYDESSGRLIILHAGHILCRQDDGGYLLGTEELTEDQKNICRDVVDMAKDIRDYVGQYESSPQMNIPGITEYRKLAEYGDTVFGGMYSEDHGFMFSTWQLSKDRSSAFWGHYTPDYDAAKQDFAIRAGLANADTIFTEKEAGLLCACLDYTKNNCESLTYEQDEQIGALMGKIAVVYLQLEASLPSFEQDDTPQLNL